MVGYNHKTYTYYTTRSVEGSLIKQHAARHANHKIAMTVKNLKDNRISQSKDNMHESWH